MKIIEYGNNWLIQDQLDDKLLNDIKNFFDKNLEFLYSDKEGYSTKGKNVEQYWIEKRGKKPFYYKNREYEDIKRKFKKQIHGRLKAASLLRDFDIELNQNGAWTIIGEEGSYHGIHTHCDGKMDGVSVVLYLNVPHSIQEDDSNCIFLVLHANPSSLFMKQGCSGIQHIKPEVGTVLIFPYHIPHGTYPQTKGIRQTFNIDFNFSTELEPSINYS